MDRSHTRRHLAIAATAIALIAAACGGSSATHGGESTAAGATATTATRDPAPAGPFVPTTVFSSFDGASATLADFSGQPIVLNFWASWCPSCVAEMSQAFRPAQEAYGSSVTFIGMNIQDERDVALRLLDETGVDWFNAEDPQGALFRELGGLGMPFTVFINAAGEIVDTHNGPLTEVQLVERITGDLIG